MSLKVKIIARTWIRDNYNLFDYDLDRDMTPADITAKAEGAVVRRIDDVHYINYMKKSQGVLDETQTSPDDKHLLYLKNIDGGVKAIAPNGKVAPQLWRVVPRSESESVTVDISDTIKLGKKTFKILQVNAGGNTSGQLMFDVHNHYEISNIKNTFISEANSPMTSSIASQSKETVGAGGGFTESNKLDKQREINEDRTPCRICLSSSSSRKNPLLAPCACKGSARWIHFECLSQWIGQRVVINERQHYASIKSKCIKCELCTTLFPPTVVLSGSEGASDVFPLYTFKNLKFEKFIVLEDGDGMIYLLNLMTKTTFTIGRGHECDIKLSEITVSRKHMKLIFDASTTTLRLSDCTSKFGTLILLQKPIQIPLDTFIELQSGRTFLRLKRLQNKSRIRTFFSNILCCRKGDPELLSRGGSRANTNIRAARPMNERRVTLEQHSPLLGEQSQMNPNQNIEEASIEQQLLFHQNIINNFVYDASENMQERLQVLQEALRFRQLHQQVQEDEEEQQDNGDELPEQSQLNQQELDISPENRIGFDTYEDTSSNQFEESSYNTRNAMATISTNNNNNINNNNLNNSNNRGLLELEAELGNSFRSPSVLLRLGSNLPQYPINVHSQLQSECNDDVEPSQDLNDRGEYEERKENHEEINVNEKEQQQEQNQVERSSLLNLRSSEQQIISPDLIPQGNFPTSSASKNDEETKDDHQ